jgi:hypothetical protein
MRSSAPTGGGSACTQEVVGVGWLSACRGRWVVEEKCLDHRVHGAIKYGSPFGPRRPLVVYHVGDTRFAHKLYKISQGVAPSANLEVADLQRLTLYAGSVVW